MEFTKDELDILIHFAILGQNYVIDRNNWRDREVAKELEPALAKACTIRKGLL